MNVFITGTAGFIGYHLAELLLQEGHTVHGYDGLTDYYDVALKRARHGRLRRHAKFSATEALLEDNATLQAAIDRADPEVIVHLAGQPGVRYSIENPRAYLEANVIGTFNVMEGARRRQIRHLLMASTSSVYGANTDMPFAETQKADTPMSFYAATKKAAEAMSHSHAHIYHLPTTMFRFFTVYGPWGRPDMAPFKFTRAILAGKPIDIYNHGHMWRDFTFVTDLVRGIRLLIDCPPPPPLAPVAGESGAAHSVPRGVAHDSLSPVAPWRVVNIGNSDKVALMDFIAALEDALGTKAIRHYMDMQPGDVPATWADASLLRALTGYRPETDFREGVRRFVHWYQDFYRAG